MEPENFSFLGYILLSTGLVLLAIGGFLFGEVYFCTINGASCPLSATDAAARLGYSIPLLIFGSIMITPGAIFAAAGHITEHLRPEVSKEEPEEETPRQSLRVCVKCGRQVDPSAGYCPNCGNQLPKQ